MRYNFDIPTKISFLTLEQLQSEILGNFNGKSILFFITERMAERFLLTQALEKLKQTNHLIQVSQISPNPTEKDVEAALRNWNKDIDTVIALGGGSTIDLAKATIGLSYLCNKDTISSEVIKKEIITKNYLNYPVVLDFIAIPTTAGTSSEVTSWATIWDTARSMKMSVEAKWLAPSTAYIIPELTLRLTDRLTLTTGLDALSHAVESYWSKSSNVITREFSKNAISIIVEYLPRALKDPRNIEYRERLCLGALLSGMAFGNTKTTACHSISYPLTMRYGIEHGFAVIITLAEVMKRNEAKIVDFEGLLKAFGASSVQDVQRWINQTCEGIQRIKLRDFGIGKDDIDEIAQAAFTVGRMDNNPAELSIQDVKTILLNCYE
mgnify:CR=1 FL=1|jgi:alcohol dehydrogenase class IV